MSMDHLNNLPTVPSSLEFLQAIEFILIGRVYVNKLLLEFMVIGRAYVNGSLLEFTSIRRTYVNGITPRVHYCNRPHVCD